MHVIARPRLRAFASEYPDAAAWLDGWWAVARRATWRHLADVRRSYNATDVFGHCTIFDVRGNKYRLIAHIDYSAQLVFVRAVLTHAEYDRGGWKHDC